MHPSGPVVDAHLHVWDPGSGLYGWLHREPAALQRPFSLEDVAPSLARHRVDGVVLVQAADEDADTDAMFAVAAAHPEVLGVVGYLPLHQPERTAARLAELRGRDRFVGVRALIHDQPDPDWLLRADVAESLALLEQAGLPLDLPAVLPRHLEHVPRLSARFPGLAVVVDHLAKPRVGTTDREPWTSLIRAAAENPRVVAKVSGLYPVAGDPDAGDVERLRPWFETALELFGPSRLLVGSDWPVAVAAGGYDRVFGAVVDLVTGYGPEVAAPLLAGTAVATYGLQLPPPA